MKKWRVFNVLYELPDDLLCIGPCIFVITEE